MIDENIFSKLSEPIRDLQNECSVEIIGIIMRRLKHIKEEPDSTGSAQYDEDLLEIGKIKSSYESKIHKNIETAIMAIAELTYNDCDDLYKFIRQGRKDFKKDKELFDLTNEMITAMLLLFHELNKDYYVKMRSLKTPNVKTYVSLKTAYKQIINKAETAKESLLDFDSLLENTIDDLITGLLKVYIAQGLIANEGYYSADTAIENLLNQALVETAQRVYDHVGKVLNCSAIEISAHMAPAVDHAPCQGHQFTIHNWEMIQSGLDFIDINGNKYIGFPRHIGTCNCRHIVRPFIIGVTKPTHDDRELENILKANERGYTTKEGKHYTFYECTQKLNYFRRKMKEAENGLKLAKEIGNESLISKYEAYYARYKKMYEMFKKQLDTRLYIHN